MIKGADKELVKNLEAWVAAADTDEERESRLKGVEVILFGGADPEEVKRISALLDEEDKPAPEPPEPREPVKLYSKERRGYMRSTNEEGIGAELREMSREASGTPFFDAGKLQSSSPLYAGSSQELIDRLRSRMRPDTRKK